MLEHLAVVGATGVVGREFLSLAEERDLPVGRLSLLASQRTAGTRLTFRGRDHSVQVLNRERLSDVTLAVFSAGAQVSREFAPIVAANGGVVVDNSSAFRMRPDVPLVVPEVNADDLAGHRGIIANPNCCVAIMLAAIGPIHRLYPLRRMVLSTYQAASGAGRRAMEELEQQARDHLDGRPIRPVVLPHPIAFNLFAHNSAVDAGGYNQEELKIIEETRKILHAPELAVTVTCVRVPVFRAHSIAVNLTFDRPASPEQIREVLETAPGVRVVDDREGGHFPMPIEAGGGDDVLVGRIRSDLSQPDGRGVDLFLCGDQLRKGAALNAIQIAEMVAGIECAGKEGGGRRAAVSP